jgi:PAS domain S-box-containing protein
MVDAVHADRPHAGTGDPGDGDRGAGARPTGAAPTRGDVLEAVAFAAERFLRAARWRDAVDDVLERLGRSADASRAYVVRTDADATGDRTSTWIAEWCDDGVTSLLRDPVITTASWDGSGFGRWADVLARGETVAGATRAMAPEERAVLEAHGVVAVVSVPVVVEGEWWGAIGFDDCLVERDWSGPELDALRTASSLLSAAIERESRDERLHAAEGRYRTFIETIPAVTYTDVITPTGATLGYVSPQIEAILGYPQQAFLDDPQLWFRVMHPEDLAALEGRNAFANDDDRPFDEEYRMITADGRTVWVHDTSLAVKADDGSIAYFQGFLIDITMRRTAQDALRSAQERFRVLVEQLPAAVYSEGVEPGSWRSTGIDYISPVVGSIVGYAPERWIDEPDFWLEVVHPDDRERAFEHFERTDATGEPLSVDYRLLAADGNPVWIHEEAVLVRDERGEPEHWLGFMLDITERMAAAEQVRVAEERFRAIVEHTPAISYQEDASTDDYEATSSIAYVSPQIETVLGYTPEEWAVPGFWAAVMHPDDLPAVLELGASTAASGEPYRQDYRMRAKDGRWVWFHDESHVIRDADGTPLFWQGVMVDITDRKLAEQELGAAQSRLRALIEHIPAVVYTQAIDGAQDDFWISPQVADIFGYTPDEWAETEDFWEEHLHPDDRDAVLALDAETDAQLHPFRLEYRLLKADGTYAWVLDEAVFVPNVGETGKGFWQGLLFDITARREAEEQLRRAERLFRATVEHLPAIVYRESPGDAERFYISPQVETVTGWTAEAWNAERGFWRAHIHPDDVAFVTDENRRTNETKEPYSVEYRFRCRDGSWMWLHDEATYIDEPGSDGFWQGFMFDVSERKQAEEQLREAEEKFRTIVEQNQAIFYIQEIDPDDPSVSLTTYIAPGNTDLIGYTPEEIQDDPRLWRRIIHPDDRERVEEADASSNAGDEDHFSMEYRMIRKDGRIVWVQDEARLIQREGRPPYWQGFLLDVTERKQAEEQLAHALEVEREATARLRTLDDMKNTFLQAVSHDLRTPLAAILGLAITLERHDADIEPEEKRELAQRIAGNARRLDRLVTNLLDLDRLARGIVTPKLQPTDVTALVRRVVDEAEPIERGRLRLDLDTPVTANVDAAKVERIVENLLANTARHTPSHATIWISVRRVDDGVLLAIEDDGPGVAPPIRETIFEPFQQGPDAPQHSPGVGVGLTLVRRFAELHGGRAWVQGRHEGGASFRVFLPSGPPAAGEGPFPGGREG